MQDWVVAKDLNSHALVCMPLVDVRVTFMACECSVSAIHTSSLHLTSMGSE